jgi:hypothetical protein
MSPSSTAVDATILLIPPTVGPRCEEGVREGAEIPQHPTRRRMLGRVGR